MSSLRFFAGKPGANSTSYDAIPSRWVNRFRWRAGASVRDNKQWPSFADSRGTLIVSSRMPGLTLTKLEGWKFIEVRYGGSVLWRCHIVSHAVQRGLQTYELRLNSYAGRLIDVSAFFPGSVDSNESPLPALKSFDIERAEGFNIFERGARFEPYRRLQDLATDMQRHLHCLALANPTDAGFKLYGYPLESTNPPSRVITTASTDVVPKSAYHTELLDMRRDTQDGLNLQGRVDKPSSRIIAFNWRFEASQERYDSTDGRWWYTINMRRFGIGIDHNITELRIQRPQDWYPHEADLFYPEPYSDDRIKIVYRTHLGAILIGAKGRRLRVTKEDMPSRFVPSFGYIQRIRVTWRTTNHYRAVQSYPIVYGNVVGNALGSVPTPQVVNWEGGDQIRAQLKKLNTFIIRVYTLTIIPDAGDKDKWRIRTGDVIALVHEDTSVRALVASVEIDQRGSRLAQLRLGLIRLGDYVATQRGEGSPIFFGSRAVTYAEGDTIGYVRPPLLQYGDMLVRFASKGISYD